MKTTAGSSHTQSLTEHLQSLQIFLPRMASPGNHSFSLALKTGKTLNKWDQLKSLKIGVWCENFNVHQVLIYVCILNISK